MAARATQQFQEDAIANLFRSGRNQHNVVADRQRPGGNRTDRESDKGIDDQIVLNPEMTRCTIKLKSIIGGLHDQILPRLIATARRAELDAVASLKNDVVIDLNVLSPQPNQRAVGIGIDLLPAQPADTGPFE